VRAASGNRRLQPQFQVFAVTPWENTQHASSLPGVIVNIVAALARQSRENPALKRPQRSLRAV
jgi:hypothetical protein